MSFLEDIINGLWDAVFPDELGALQGIYDFLVNIPLTIAEIAVAMLYLAVYPGLMIFNVIYDFTGYVYYQIASFLNVFIDIPNLAIYTAENTIGVVFPPIWVWLFFLILALRVLFIIINRLARIEILGFSLGGGGK